MHMTGIACRLLICGLAFTGAALAEEPGAEPRAAVGEAPLKFPSPLGIHRGGRGLWPENTAYAYEQAAQRWPEALLEGDVHVSADGVAVMMHDHSLDRTTNGEGPIKKRTLAELKALDAAYDFTTDDGATFPLRGQGITIPTFEEGLRAAPTHHYLIELKDGVDVVAAALKAIRAADATDRVIIASFNPLFMNQLREQAPEIRTSFDTQTAMKMVMALRGPDWDTFKPVDDLLTYSPGLGKTMALQPEELAKIQAKGVAVQVHTINKEEEMREYLKLGVDSILTDYPDRLDKVIQEQQAGNK